MAKKPTTADELRAQAEALAQQAKELRKEANKQARKEKREREAAERERMQAEAVAMLEFSKTIMLTVEGEQVSFYDTLRKQFEQSRSDAK